MISSAYGFIFLHAPKTAGNSMQLVLQPFSDDRISRIHGRDPTQQFGLKGPVSTKKYAKLQDYARRLGSDLAGRRVGTPRKPDMVIRYEQLASDFKAFARNIGLPIGASDLPHANASAAGEDLHRAASRDPAVRTAVKARFAADYEFLETIGR